MRWIRSWPTEDLPGRAHVVDDLPRVYTTDYDYTPLGEIDDDVCLIEWDIALAPDMYGLFEELVESHGADKPLAAAHKLYHVEPEPVWAHRRIVWIETSVPPYRERWIYNLEPFCDYFAFGLVYLPRELIRAFLDSPAPARGAPLVAPGGYTDSRMTDQTFSMWYRHRYPGGGPVRVEWSVQPVHLHGRER